MNATNLNIKLVFAFLSTLLSVSTLVAQNDTMYIMKSGAVIGKYNVNNQIDSIIFYNPGTGNTVTDIDGNVYTTVTIGTQIWMKENLKVTRYPNGTNIPFATNAAYWDTLVSTSRAYCWYNDNIANKDVYGALYTWAAAVDGTTGSATNPSGIQGLCPCGWHLPSDAEWAQMENYLADNGYNYDGTTGGGRAKIAKSMADSVSWVFSSVIGAPGNTDYPVYRNKSGFTAVPSGYRNLSGNFIYLLGGCDWWTTTEYNIAYVWARGIIYNNVPELRVYGEREVGFSVRCVKD